MRLPRIFVMITLCLLSVGLFWQQVTPVSAGTITLNNNSGTTSSSFFIDGEPTLVMNGFDLGALNLGGSVVLDTVTIAVQQPVAGVPVEVVIYEDANGGSPIDATLAYQTQAFIETGGTAFITLPDPVTITAPVVWVGFYLPNGFRFFADNSGTSVLTYWGWTPGSSFNLADLSSASVFGASDGSEPVNIDMGGVARITAEITPLNASGFSGDGTDAQGLPIGTQIEGGEADLSQLSNYEFCGDLLLYDPADVNISGQRRFTTHCRADLGAFAPGTFINADDLPATVPSYERRGFFYEVFVNGETAQNSSEEMLVPVTHCIRPNQADLTTAVIGVAYGAPRAWEILPTVSYGEWVCAEVTHAGFLSYFVPRTGDEATLNADLYFSSNPIPVGQILDSELGYFCGYPYTIAGAIRNEGFVATPLTDVRIQVINQRTGTVTATQDYVLPPVLPGTTFNLSAVNFEMPLTFINETTILRVIIDPENLVAEVDENNNTYELVGLLILEADNCAT